MNSSSNVFCACWNDHISLKWQKCGSFVLIFSINVFLTLILPFITMIAKSLLPPFLPLVSDTGGYPPCSGIFSIFLHFTAFSGLIAFPIIYETINHRNKHNWRYLKLANKLGLFFILSCLMGTVITGNNPVGYTDVPNKYEWVMTVLGEHGVGAVMLLIGGGLYQFFLCGIWWYLSDTNKADRYIKLGFVVLYTLFFFLSMYPLPTMLVELLGPFPFDFAHMKKISHDLTREYTVSYIICAFCEYGFCISSAINIGLLYKDLQKVSLRVVLRHKSCTTETVEPSPSIKLNIIS